MHTPRKAILVSQENLHVIQQENANGFQRTWNPTLPAFIKGGFQSKQSTLGFLLELQIGEHNATTCMFVLAKCPPVAEEVQSFPNIPQAIAEVFFKQPFVNKRKAIPSPFK